MTKLKTQYTWDIPSDHFEWDHNAAQIFGANVSHDLNTGEKFRARIAPEHVDRWLQALAPLSEPTTHTPYRIRYRIAITGAPQGETTYAYVEDVGTWTADAHGVPRLAKGTIRILDEFYATTLKELQDIETEPTTIISTHPSARQTARQSIENLLRNDSSPHTSAYLLMAAIDNLKGINTEYGFDTGDILQRAVQDVLSSNIGPAGELHQYAYNRWIVLLKDTNSTAAEEKAHRLIEDVRGSRLPTNLGPLPASISIGISEVTPTYPSADAVIEAALQALDYVRDNQQGQVRTASEGNRDHRLTDDPHVLGSVVNALDKNKLRLALQPVVDAKSHDVVFYECLARIEKEDGTLLSAGAFMERVERVGLVGQLDCQILAHATDFLKTHPNEQVSLNVSRTSAGDPKWLSILDQAATEDPSLTSRLVVEITETALVNDRSHLSDFARRVKSAGCKFALDDFGAGYTSLAELRQLQPDIVKIDGSLIKGLPGNSQAIAVVTAIVDIARAFEINVVAEWVADKATADRLCEIGVDFLQGFAFGEPVLAEKLKQS